MKKRGFLIFLVFLITVKTSFSLYQDLVFSGTVYNKDVKQIEGKEFEFRITKDFTSVGIGFTGVIIKSGDCKIRGNFNVCITNVSWAYRNSTTWEDIYKALVKVYVVKSSLTVTKNIPKTKLLIDEEADVELNLENTADIPVENVILTETYPTEFLVSDAEGCSLAFNTITFKGQVSPRQIRTCKYKLKGLKPTTYTSVVQASYFDGAETKNITNTKTITILNYSLEVELTKGKDKVTVGDDLDLTLTLRNINKNEDLTITSFVFTVPNGFIIKKKPRGMTQNNKLLIWGGKIEKDSGLNYTTTLTAARSGKQAFDINKAYKIAGFLRDFSESYEFNVFCDCPFIDYKIGSIIAGLKTDFMVSIKNPGSINFRNLKIDYQSNIPKIRDYSSAYGTIAKESAISLLKKRINSPPEGEEYYFDISIAYESPFNEVFVEKKEIKVKLPSKQVEKEKPKEIIVEEERLNETKAEEKVDVETQEAEKNITQESEEKGEVKQEITEKEPIVLAEEKGKIPWKAISMVAVIVILILIFVFIRVIKGKKEEEIETPPEL